MIYAVTVYCDFGLKLGLVVRKRLASLGIKSSGARWRSSSKSISKVKGYSDWNCNGFFPLTKSLGQNFRFSLALGFSGGTGDGAAPGARIRGFLPPADWKEG